MTLSTMQTRSQRVAWDGQSSSYKLPGQSCSCRNRTSNGQNKLLPPLGSCLSQKAAVMGSETATHLDSSRCSWRERIVGLFDPALRDAEDMMISLPYADIRKKAERLATDLDRLVTLQSNGPARTHLLSVQARKPKAFSSSPISSLKASEDGTFVNGALSPTSVDASTITRALYDICTTSSTRTADQRLGTHATIH
jgi:hypothetical protein